MATEVPLHSLSVWASLSAELKDAFCRHDIYTASDLVGLFDGTAEEAEGVPQELSPGSCFAQPLVELFSACQSAHSRHVQRMSNFSDSEAAASAVKRARHNERIRLQLDPPAIACADGFVPHGKSKPVKWPTILKRRLASADGRGAREKAEADERVRWLLQLRSR